MKVLAEIAPADLPEGWPMRRVRDVATLINGFPFKSEDFDSSGEVPLVRIRDLTASDFELFVPKSAVPDESLMRNGDLAIGMDGDFNAVLWTRGPAALNQRVCILRPRRGTDISFLGYVLPSVLKIINDLTYSTTVKHLSGSDVLQQLIPFPDFELQQRICQFLDCETAQIDDLIGKQERLIELLAEKRQTIITHAVTKGLDPNAPTKDSGIPWLGDIPAHWNVTTVRRLASVISKGTTPTTVGAEFTDEGIRFLKAENIQNNAVMDTPANFISEETNRLLARSELRRDDLLVVIAGATTGKSAVLSLDLTPCNTNQAVAFVRPRDPSMSRWMHHVLTTPSVQNLISSLSVQSAQPNLSMGDLGSIWLPLPPAPEIDSILSQTLRSTGRLDALTTSAQRAVDLLRERRSALISAAVTGKIDVREGASKP